MTAIYFNGDGKGFIAPATRAAVVRDLGNIAGLKYAPKVEITDHTETSSGERTMDFSIIDGKSAEITVSLEAFDRKALATYFMGADSVVDAGTVTAEVLPTGLVAGDEITLAHPRVSSLVVKDSTGSPVTLTLNTHYETTATGLAYGRFTIKSVSGLTQPLKADYSYGESIPITMMSADLTPQYLRFEGMNRANSKAKFLIEWWKAQIVGVVDMEFITEKGVWKGTLTAKLLGDTSKAEDAELGIFGRLTLLEDAA